MDKEQFVKKIGERVRELRLSKGISLYELGFLGSFDKAAISKIENGKKEMTIYSLAKICQSLDISIEEFFEGFPPLESMN